MCSKLDICYKIKMVLDKEMLDEQFAECVKAVCGKCKDNDSKGGISWET